MPIQRSQKIILLIKRPRRSKVPHIQNQRLFINKQNKTKQKQKQKHLLLAL